MTTPTPPLSNLYPSSSALHAYTASYAGQPLAVSCPSNTSYRYLSNSGTSVVTPATVSSGFQTHFSNEMLVESYVSAPQYLPPQPSRQQDFDVYFDKARKAELTSTVQTAAHAVPDSVTPMPALTNFAPKHSLLPQVAAPEIVGSHDVVSSQTASEPVPLTEKLTVADVTVTERPAATINNRKFPKIKVPNASTALTVGSVQSQELSKTDVKQSEGDVAKKNKVKANSKPPQPRYKELVSAGGQSFFKCLNCGQTLCSMENFMDHWKECIVKKPLIAKPKRPSITKDKKNLQTFSSQQSIDETIAAVASESFVIDELAIGNSLLQEQNLAELVLESDSVVEGKCLQGSKESGLQLGPNTNKDATVNGETAAPETAIAEKEGSAVAQNSETTPVAKTDNVCVAVAQKLDLSLSDTDTTLESVAEVSPSPSSKRPVSRITTVSENHKRHHSKKRRNTKSNGQKEQLMENVKAAAHSNENVGDGKFCRLCKRNFHCRLTLIQHLSCKHVKSYTVKKQGETKTYRCNLCGRVFVKFSGYMSHVASHSHIILTKFDKIRSCEKKKRGRPTGWRKVTHLSTDHMPKAQKIHKEDEEDIVQSRRLTRRSVSASSSVVSFSKIPDEDSTDSDRRSIEQTLPKQPVTKIYVSSLGIGISTNPVMANNKRRYSSERGTVATESKAKQRRREGTNQDKKNVAQSGEEDVEKGADGASIRQAAGDREKVCADAFVLNTSSAWLYKRPVRHCRSDYRTPHLVLHSHRQSPCSASSSSSVR